MTTTGRTFLLFSNAGTGAETGAVVTPQLALDTDEDAKIQVTAADGTPTFSLRIEGKLRPELPWAPLNTVASSDFVFNDTLIEDCPMAPYMRVNVTVNADTTAGNLTVYVLN